MPTCSCSRLAPPDRWRATDPGRSFAWRAGASNPEEANFALFFSASPADIRRVIPLEDNVGDIVGKAQRGLGISGESLREQAGITQAQLRAAKGDQPPLDVLRKVAPVLRL